MPNDYGLAWAEEMRDRQEPPGSEPKLTCDRCGTPIYEGEPFYNLEGKTLCGECVWDLYGRYA